jgi:hypothetical protein
MKHQKLEKPLNDWAKCLWILIDSYLPGVSMAKVLTVYSPTFYKWQTRLSNILEAHPKLKVSKVTIPYTDKITGKSKHYTQYTLLSNIKHCINTYNFINKNGCPKPKE